MCPLYTDYAAIIYSELWTMKTYKRLNKYFPNTSFVLIIFINDTLEAFSILIKNGDFEIKKLEFVKDIQSLDRIECNGYLVIPSDIFLKGIEAIKLGISQNKVIMKNEESLEILSKIIGDT